MSTDFCRNVRITEYSHKLYVVKQRITSFLEFGGGLVFYLFGFLFACFEITIQSFSGIVRTSLSYTANLYNENLIIFLFH